MHQAYPADLLMKNGSVMVSATVECCFITGQFYS